MIPLVIPLGRLRREVNRVRAAADSIRSGVVSGVPPREPEPCLDLGDLGATHGNPVRGGAIELDHGAVALLADEADMRDRHDVAAMDPDEQAGIELRFGLRDRPWTHPLAGA